MRRIFIGLLLASPGVFSQAHAQPSVFERCAACHSGTDATKDVAPNLAGVVGRKAGSREDFRYSRALTRSGITWDESSLDAFLKGPEQFVPGTRMPFEGIASDAERAAIIQYLKSLR
jgi:cytochrome c